MRRVDQQEGREGELVDCLMRGKFNLPFYAIWSDGNGLGGMGDGLIGYSSKKRLHSACLQLKSRQPRQTASRKPLHFCCFELLGTSRLE